MSTIWPIPLSENFPALVRVDFLGYSLPVHPLYAGPFRWVDKNLRGLYVPSGPDTGTFADRNINHTPPGPATWEDHSEHAHGTTVDLNWQQNPGRTDIIICDFTDAVLEAFLAPVPGLDKPAFKWGGNWSSDLQEGLALLHKIRANGGQLTDPGWNDAMHMEGILTPAECQKVKWDALIEEEELTPGQQQALWYAQGLRKGLEGGKAPAKEKDGYEDKVAGWKDGRALRKLLPA